MGLFEELAKLNQQSALNAYCQQYANSRGNRFGGLSDGLHAHGVLDPGHSHALHQSMDGPDSKRALECLLDPNAAPKNEIPDEVLLLLEV